MGNDLHLLEISVYHNLILMATNGQQDVLVWNYELMKLMSILTLLKNEEATAAKFIPGYNVFVIST